MKETAIFLIAIFALSSCEKDNDKEPVIPVTTTLLTGKWDAYHGIYADGPVDGLQYSVLFNYEHGFEIFGNGVYKSRVVNQTTLESGLHTIENSGTWTLKKDTLAFFYTHENVTSSLYFLVLSVDAGDLKIKLIGNNDFFSDAFQQIVYLRKAN
jgi:hypothetical protein